MSWYFQVLKKYAVFSGRAGRKEYWYFFLFNFILGFVLGFIDGLIGTSGKSAGIGLLGGIYMLAVLIPSIAVSVRRLHDTDRSGWWLLISLIPFIGAIVLLVFMVQNSQRGENRHGPNQKSAGLCKECGKEIDDNAVVCPHCGASVQRLEM